jgi:hypothetical protein
MGPVVLLQVPSLPFIFCDAAIKTYYSTSASYYSAGNFTPTLSLQYLPHHPAHHLGTSAWTLHPCLGWAMALEIRDTTMVIT